MLQWYVFLQNLKDATKKLKTDQKDSVKLQDTKIKYISILYFYKLVTNYQKEKFRK